MALVIKFSLNLGIGHAQPNLYYTLILAHVLLEVHDTTQFSIASAPICHCLRSDLFHLVPNTDPLIVPSIPETFVNAQDGGQPGCKLACSPFLRSAYQQGLLAMCTAQSAVEFCPFGTDMVEGSYVS